MSATMMPEAGPAIPTRGVYALSWRDAFGDRLLVAITADGREVRRLSAREGREDEALRLLWGALDEVDAETAAASS
jgi:hypothetical protein